jgi:hypothetical protein
MSTIIQKTEIEDQFQIAPNAKFNVLPHKGITLSKILLLQPSMHMFVKPSTVLKQ